MAAVRTGSVCISDAPLRETDLLAMHDRDAGGCFGLCSRTAVIDIKVNPRLCVYCMCVVLCVCL